MAKRDDFDFLPPETFLIGHEVLWLKAFGSRREMAHDLTDGGCFEFRRHKIKELVKDWAAVDDLSEFIDFCDHVGRRLCEGDKWRDIIDDLHRKWNAS